jgi:hypothetical protein
VLVEDVFDLSLTKTEEAVVELVRPLPGFDFAVSS